MDGIHDLGGKQGFGPVVQEADEPVFHADWEPKVFTLVLASVAIGARNNVDQFRHAVERIDPVAYLTHTYYGRWLGGIENLLVESGVLSRAEIDARYVACGGRAGDSVASRPSPNPDRLGAAPDDAGAARSLQHAAAFAVGDAVVTQSSGAVGHTRLPGYARGRRGHVVALHGGWVYPDTHAHGCGESPQHLYTVAFEGEELWGSDCEPGLVVHLDLFEPYLKPARAVA